MSDGDVGTREAPQSHDDPLDSDFLVLQSGDDVVKDDVPLPQYRLRFQPTGISYMDDLSSEDREKIRHIALVELSTIFERYNLPFSVSRHRRRTTATPTDSRLLGVSLTSLLDRDQLRTPAAKCPVFVEKILQFLDENALKEEGILRIPGNTARLKRLREELEIAYESGSFTWDGWRTNDAATLLKQFLRELPVPLLTNEYLRAFAAAEAIPSRRDQVGALNLLILLIPDVHRETLRVLLRQMKRITEHEEHNKMGLSNVSLIIAPNLFCQLGKMSWNADSEVQLAAGTSHVVRLMINYWELLFVVPNILINQLRDMNEADVCVGQQPRKSRNFKDLKKVLTNQRKSSVTISVAPRTTELPSPVVGQVSKNHHYVIKVLSPEFPRISMILEINNHSRVCEVLTNFRRKQLGLISPHPNSTSAIKSTASNTSRAVEESSSLHALDLSVAKNNQKRDVLGSLTDNSTMSPASTTSSIDIDNLCLKASTPSTADTFSSRRHSSPVGPAEKIGDEDLYECEGNIGCRRLREGALVMEILKENPSTNFYVLKRSSAAHRLVQPP